MREKVSLGSAFMFHLVSSPQVSRALTADAIAQQGSTFQQVPNGAPRRGLIFPARAVDTQDLSPPQTWPWSLKCLQLGAPGHKQRGGQLQHQTGSSPPQFLALGNPSIRCRKLGLEEQPGGGSPHKRK